MVRCRVLVALAVLALVAGAFAPDAEARRLCSCSHCFGSPLFFCIPPGQSSPIYCFEYYEQNCWHGLAVGEVPQDEAAFLESLSGDPVSVEAEGSRGEDPVSDVADDVMSPLPAASALQD